MGHGFRVVAIWVACQGEAKAVWLVCRFLHVVIAGCAVWQDGSPHLAYQVLYLVEVGGHFDAVGPLSPHHALRLHGIEQ